MVLYHVLRLNRIFSSARWVSPGEGDVTIFKYTSYGLSDQL